MRQGNASEMTYGARQHDLLGDLGTNPRISMGPIARDSHSISFKLMLRNNHHLKMIQFHSIFFFQLFRFFKDELIHWHLQESLEIAFPVIRLPK